MSVSDDVRRTDATVTIDVSRLPETVFGHESLTWWATATFMLVEGTTLAVLATSYFYLRLNEPTWPPRPWPPPALAVPLVNTALLLLLIWPMQRAKRAAFALDGAGVTQWLVVATLGSLLCTVGRAFEYGALRIRWDANAYGSVAWGLLTAHTLLLVTDVLETGVMALLFARGRYETRHFSDVEDAAVYQVFLSLAGAAVFAMLFLVPRAMS